MAGNMHVYHKKRKGEAAKERILAASPDKAAATYSPTAQRSTIGVRGLNFSVRNGKRWIPAAVATCMALYHYIIPST